MADRDRPPETSWICELCGHRFSERRPEGDDPQRCESCGFGGLRGFRAGDPVAEDFAEEVHRRNQAIRRAPALSRRGRANRPRPRG